MLLLNNGLVSYTLDSYLDIEKFLSLKDEFYFLFASNHARTKDVWNSGGIPFDLNWEYLTKNPLMYHTYHNYKDEDIYINQLADKNARTYYLKLKYKCFSPYKILHLNEFQQPMHEWVIPEIQEWIATLPFSNIDMVSMFFNDHYVPLKYHRDYNYLPVEEGNDTTPPSTVQDIIWFRFDLSRGFNFYDIDSDGNILETYPVGGYSATFNHYNWHGNTEAHHSPSLTMKVEGVFTDEFRKKIYG